MFLIKKPVLLMLIVLFCLPIIYAADFTVESIPILNVISLDDAAKFDLNITNNLGTKEEFRVYSLNYPEWDVYTKPIISPILVQVEPSETKTIRLNVKPLHITRVGKYIININVRSQRTKRLVKTPIQLNIKSIGPLIMGYVPTIIASIRMPKTIDPREEITMEITLDNQNMLDYPMVVVRLESNLIKEEIKEELGPKEVKTIKITKELDALTQKQKDTLILTVLRDDRIITGPLAQLIEIIEYSETKETIEKRFLKTKKEMVIISNNKDFKGPIRIETSSLKSLFTSTTPKADIVKIDGKKYHSWDVVLGPNKSMTIKITESYRPLFLIIILLIIAIALYYVYRSPLIIIKTLSTMTLKEGGISEMKVMLTIKNRSKKPIKDVEVIETLPNIVDVGKGIDIGTLKPYTILKHEIKGSIIKWRLEHLDDMEERVLTYKIKSRLPILGDLNLNPTLVKFRYNEKETIARSNTLSISS